MNDLSALSQTLRSGQPLTDAQAEAAARLLAGEAVEIADKKAFLTALAEKGETVADVAAFARVYRELAVDPGLQDWAETGVDIVGTGGSGSGGYNISSVTAFTLAAAGVPVMKHGNRAITSQSGTADFLSMLGVPVDADPQRLRKALETLNFCFFFAPSFHPAFKHIMPVRKELAAEGRSTVFNVLGPLINPARPRHQLLGVAIPHMVEPLAEALTELGVRRGLAVHSALFNDKRMDEFTTAGNNQLAGIGELANVRENRAPDHWGFVPAQPESLIGGTAEENWQLFQDIINGSGRSALVDSIVLNAAAALWIVEKADSISEGLPMARELLLGGAVRDWVTRARAFFEDEVR